MKPTRCGKCPADVIFLTMMKRDGTESRGVVDAQPTERGNIRVVETATRVEGRVLTKHDLAHAQRNGLPLHLSHFVTCPEAQAFRRGDK